MATEVTGEKGLCFEVDEVENRLVEVTVELMAKRQNDWVWLSLSPSSSESSGSRHPLYSGTTQNKIVP